MSNKVLILHMEYPPMMGGGARYSENLIKGLMEKDISIVLLTSGEKDSIEIVNKKLTIKRYKAFQDIKTWKGELMMGVVILHNEIIKENPDLIHTIYFEETLIGQIVNKNFGLPHFVTHTKNPMSDGDNYENNQAWPFFDHLNCQKNIFFIAPSKIFKQDLIRSGVNEGDIQIIYPGVDRNIYKPITHKNLIVQMRSRLQISDEDALILVPCVIRKRKGLDYIAESLSNLKIPNKKYKIIVTGIAKYSEETEIYSNFVNKIGQDKVVIHDRFEDDEMPILYNMADVTLLCSESEGLGIALLEAMACECPVIGTNVSGINEVIQDDYNGVLCDYGDESKLREGIIKIILNENLRNKYISNSKTLLDTKFSTRVQADKHIETYRNTVLCNKRFTVCVPYKMVDNKVEIFVVDTNSGKQLIKNEKRPSETWSSCALRSLKQEIGLSLFYPSITLVRDEQNTYTVEANVKRSKNNIVVFAFDTTTYQEALFYKKNSKGLWIEIDQLLEDNIDDQTRSALAELKNHINQQNSI